jgi:hypothetical protein
MFSFIKDASSSFGECYTANANGSYQSSDLSSMCIPAERILEPPCRFYVVLARTGDCVFSEIGKRATVITHTAPLDPALLNPSS